MDLEKRINELELELSKSRNKLNELNAFLHSFELINSTIELHTVLDYLMEVAKQMTDSEASSALLLEDGKICFAAASGVKSEEIKKIYLKKGEGIAGWVLENNKPIIIHDAKVSPFFSHKADNTSGFETHSVLAVPLKVEEKIIGVVEAVNKKNGASFDENDSRLLSTLASSAATAINKAQLYKDLNELFLSTIKALANAIEAKDIYTRGHSERIRNYSLIIAKELDFSKEEQKNIEISALLHDVGKIGVPESILRKEDKLTDEEFSHVKKHPSIGADMLCSIKQLSVAIPGIRHHQERYDGKGYPDGLSGEEIPFFARIIAVADTFDAMTSDRPYRKAMTDSAALSEIEKYSGVQFDPKCARAFIDGFRKNFQNDKGHK